MTMLLLAAGAAFGQITQLTYTPITIPMRDSNVLAADLWFTPPAATTKPVILIQTPYNRKLYRLGTIPGYAGGTLFPLSTNYNYVIVDWRGFYGSAGATVPGYNRGLDGYDCTEWIAAQPWSNGRVGTWGSSALGFIQYQTAFQHPPHLTCCNIQVMYFQTRYDSYYYGGDYRLEEAQSTAQLGLIDTNSLLAHPDYDIYWKTVEALTDTPQKIAVPVLLVGGWFDHTPDSVLQAFAELQTNSDPSVQGQHRFIFGPWTHEGVGEADQGILSFPNTTNLFSAEITYWDYHLRYMTNDTWVSQPVIQYYQTGENIWVDDRSWTGSDTWAGIPRISRTFYLGSGGQLTSTPPGSGEAPDSYAYDPNNPTPSFGGARFTPSDSTVPDGPQDESTNIETRADVLVYSTAVLTNALRLNATNLLVTLSASSGRTDTDFAVRLTDVYPDGSSIILVQGIRRAAFATHPVRNSS
ncbi:MAG: CocE/NonD family hydrolase [Limisphaerales bacterium]